MVQGKSVMVNMDKLNTLSGNQNESKWKFFTTKYISETNLSSLPDLSAQEASSTSSQLKPYTLPVVGYIAQSQHQLCPRPITMSAISEQKTYHKYNIILEQVESIKAQQEHERQLYSMYHQIQLDKLAQRVEDLEEQLIQEQQRCLILQNQMRQV
eukprot:TRINITY_DN14906_c0_g1_i1.p2 TRINITY_DN14906_c0_g1~~TRINITY_DN14906_c0_g1_i1.p2  ORF type:complete len:155 (-),score=4.95 TRINITY_DN14906_c0_g1_i1:430-894(-)